MNIFIILPNQLFENNKYITKDTKVYIYEHPVYFTKYKFHKMKLILHRASMKKYEEYLTKKYKCKVKYLEFDYDISTLFKKHKKIEIFDPVDFDVTKEFKKYNIELITHHSPLFLTTLRELQDYINKNGKYHQTSFYIWQRKRLNILVNKDKKPIGGKWTYDTKNRLPFPANFKEDVKFEINNSKYVVEAKNYINKHFKDNVGDTELYLPIDYENTKKQLHKFLKERLKCFGPYQDAVSKDILFGCHTVLSPLINIGLITPQEVVDEILKHYEKKI